MQHTDLLKISKLLETANNRGIKIYYDKELIVRYPKDTKPDASFIGELRENKPGLIAYFTDLSLPNTDHQDAPISRVTSDAEFHEITPTQQWWLTQDPACDYVYGTTNFKITGNFDAAIMRKTVRYLVNRHESLRSTFRKVKDEFKLKVADASSPIFDLDYKDLRETSPVRDQVAFSFFYFKDHLLNIETGPLFVSRLVRLADTEFLLSFKFHHIIYDAWSIQIFFRDLKLAYTSIVQDIVPPLPPLKFQYKEYNTFTNNFFRKYERSHREYWNTRFPMAPAELQLPGQKAVISSAESPKNNVEVFSLQSDVMNFMNQLVREYSVSLFVILQATLKSYICKSTEQEDITFGTQVFGRDGLPEGIENQIGMYADMFLIRTVLDKNESFAQHLPKVIKANQDMQAYKALSLLNHMKFLLPDKQDLTEIWKITVQYEDLNGYISDIETPLIPAGKQFEIMPVSKERQEEGVVDRIKVTFINLRERIDVNVMFNTAQYDVVEMNQFVKGYEAYAKQLVNH